LLHFRVLHSARTDKRTDACRRQLTFISATRISSLLLLLLLLLTTRYKKNSSSSPLHASDRHAADEYMTNENRFVFVRIAAGCSANSLTALEYESVFISNGTVEARSTHK